MIEKSLYENYQIDFSDSITPTNDDILFVFNDDRELHLTEDNELPKSLDDFDVDFCLFIGEYDGRKAFAVNVKTTDSFNPLPEVYEFSHDLYHIAGKAVLVRDWYMTLHKTIQRFLFVHQNTLKPVLTN